MASTAHEFTRNVLKYTCPVCKRGNGHWCRDAQGKSISPHRERRHLALKDACALLAYVSGRIA